MGGKCPADGPNFHRLYATSHQGSGNGFGCGTGRHHIIQQSHMPVVVFVEYEGFTQVFLAGTAVQSTLWRRGFTPFEQIFIHRNAQLPAECPPYQR